MALCQQDNDTSIDTNCKEESSPHYTGLYKRHHNTANNMSRSDDITSDLHLRSESPPSLLTTPPERALSCLDSPQLKSRLPTPLPSMPNLLIRKPPRLSPYRNTSAGSNSTSSWISSSERQRSSGGRLVGNNGIPDNQSSPCQSTLLPSCNHSASSPHISRRLIGYLGKMRPKRSTVIFVTLVMAVALSISNLAFLSNDSFKVLPPSRKSQTLMEREASSHKTIITEEKSRATQTFISSETTSQPVNQQQQNESWTKGDNSGGARFAAVHPPRIVCLAGNGCGDTLLSKTSSSPKYVLQMYPSEFSDVTQLYPKYPSNDILQTRFFDPHVNTIEGYGHCVPVSTWQTSFYPTCNAFHELDLTAGLRRKSVDLFGFKGFWRHAWKIIDDDYLSGYFTQRFLAKYIYNGNIFNPHTQASTISKMNRAGISEDLPYVILKSLRYEHNYEEAWYETNRIDAVAMERLTPSQHVMDIYGFCGMSAMTEFGQGNFKSIVDAATPIEKLKFARDVAEGLASTHYIDGYDRNVTLVHNDLNPSNVMMSHGNVKLNDFNVGIMMAWQKHEQRPCRFQNSFANAQWRAPEEQYIDGKYSEEPLSPKIDVYALGNIFFRIIAGHDPWKEYKIDGRINIEDQNVIAKRKRFDGEVPKFLFPDLVETSIPSIKAIYDVMLKCFRIKPEERPSAAEIAMELSESYARLTKPMHNASKQGLESKSVNQ